MSMSTPEETFAAAQAAMERGDWDELFACLEPGDVGRVVKNGLSGLGRDVRVEELCREAGVEPALVDSARALAAQMATAAQACLAGDMAASLRLKELVEGHRLALDAIIKAASDIATLAAGLERHLRATAGGGSVSSSLFAGERLEQLRVDGDRASATRRRAGGSTERIAFVRRDDRWRIRLFAR